MRPSLRWLTWLLLVLLVVVPVMDLATTPGADAHPGGKHHRVGVRGWRNGVAMARPPVDLPLRVDGAVVLADPAARLPVVLDELFVPPRA